MRRSLPPLTRPTVLGGTEVTFPLTIESSATAGVLFPLPRRVVLRELAGDPLRPVPVVPGRAGALAVFTRWERTPVGPFREIALYVLAYRGPGSPVPGLAPLLHGLLGRSALVGDLGYVPIRTLVDRDEGAAFRRDLWGVDAHRVSILAREYAGETIAQADDGAGPLLRLSITSGRAHSNGLRIRVPLYGQRDGTLWHDIAEARYETTSRRYRWGCGTITLYPRGPLEDLSADVGASSDLRRRVLAGATGRRGTVRFAGPRPVEQATETTGA